MAASCQHQTCETTHARPRHQQTIQEISKCGAASQHKCSARLRIGGEVAGSESARDRIVEIAGVEEIQDRGRPEETIVLSANLHIHRGGRGDTRCEMTINPLFILFPRNT